MISTQSTAATAQIIKAPSTEAPQHPRSVFLAGTTTTTDPVPWRTVLSDMLADQPIVIYDPYRPDWGRDWDDLSVAPYREQIEWELRSQERADIVCVYLHPVTEAPLSLLELGLAARRKGRTVVCVPVGYKHRANVLVVCEMFGIEVVDGVEGFKESVLKTLGLGSA